MTEQIDNKIGKLGLLKTIPKQELGGKAYALNRLVENQINVPDGIVIFASCFIECLKANRIYDEVNLCCQRVNFGNVTQLSKDLKNLMTHCNIDAVISDIQKHTVNLNQFVSVRSSAASEDGEQHTFAGLHDSFLNVSNDKESLSTAIIKCWASLFNERALIYRIKKGIPIFERIAVIIQNMVQAECSGVVYTKHPIENEFILIESAFGIGDSVVDGVIKPDSFLVDRETRTVIRKEIGTKKTKTENVNGKHIVRTNENQDIFSINDEVLNKLVDSSLTIESIFNKTQDIEWAYDGVLWFLQSRTVNF